MWLDSTDFIQKIISLCIHSQDAIPYLLQLVQIGFNCTAPLRVLALGLQLGMLSRMEGLHKYKGTELTRRNGNCKHVHGVSRAMQLLTHAVQAVRD